MKWIRDKYPPCDTTVLLTVRRNCERETIIASLYACVEDGLLWLIVGGCHHHEVFEDGDVISWSYLPIPDNGPEGKLTG
jgi:hypothetical protein